MTEIRKETVVTSTNDLGTDAGTDTETTLPVAVSRTNSLENFVYFVSGVLDVLLVFRFVFKLAGANPGSAFVAFIYGVSLPFVSLFNGIFPQNYAQGVTTTSVFEPATLIALLVYTFVGWGIVQLIAIASGQKS
ncbi:MAG TPA: hypothetical protein VLI92_01520 [Candidatus Saccharimonadales bacterium]|nr:hypothetical protein [Candidatus Saccharimonadales bacterium]